MISAARRFGVRGARVASLILLGTLGTTTLVRLAPGYFTDSREMDASYAQVARGQVKARRDQESSVVRLEWSEMTALLHGNLGRSRQFDVPVADLLRERAKTTVKLLAEGVLSGWVLALAFALALSARRTRRGDALIVAPNAVLLAIPAGALATACLITDFGGPALVLCLLVLSRDFKLTYRLLRHTWRAPHFLYARAQGISTARIVRTHLLRTLGGEFLALGVTSFVLALSACVPVEVIFGVPGLGQLAWSAALNRDLPVLLGVTLLMAACVGLAGTVADNSRAVEVSQCA
jgi:peptide/nickel transport system permease protein